MDRRELRISSSKFFLERETAQRKWSMLLAIDAGNTNITLGLFRDEELISQWRLLTDRQRSGNEYRTDLAELFESASIDPRDINGIAIASVVPQLDRA